MSARGGFQHTFLRYRHLSALVSSFDRAPSLGRATWALAEEAPHFSARQVITRAQTTALVALLVGVVTMFLIWPERSAEVVVAGMSAGFVGSLGLRSGLALSGRHRMPAVAAGPSDILPVYTVLVPVYREAEMIPQIARSLAALDYPKDKLDIGVVVEEDDEPTRAAAMLAGLNSIVVPVGMPRTKPKACNYALQYARGAFTVIYDAEDRPERDQLRKAVAAFRADPGASCFQARLAVDRGVAWVARMFAIDYSLWFRTLLPGLGCLGAPIPLGGTSNHFRTKALIEAGAWDPFNVTEDADLGVRLARLGHRVGLLDSTTFEEAPGTLQTWLRQRTRWMKGYMQTLLVHTRNPLVVLRQLGPRGLFLFLSFLGGAVWSAVVNPVLWLICVTGLLFADADSGTLALLARISGLALLSVNALLATLAVLAERGGRWGGNAALVISYPLYWLLISAATYRAIWQLLCDPFRWEKTPHDPAQS